MKKYNFMTIMYIISLSFTSFAIGLFTLAFNLHINSIISSKFFLSNFLLVGNIAMALGGVIFGKILDKYNKTRILLVATILSAFFFAFECFITDKTLLYLVSLCYGLIFSILMSIHTPFIIEYVDEKNQAFTFNLCSSCKLFSSTLGIYIGGYIPLNPCVKLNGSQYQNIFIIASVSYFFAIVPLLFIQKKEKKTDTKMIKNKKTKSIPRFSAFSIIFLILGLLLFFSPYMNLYLNNKYEISLKNISIIITLIEIFPVVTNILLGKLFDYFEEIHIISACSFICIILYGLLAIFPQLLVQVILLLCVTIISSFLFPHINRFILKLYPKEKMGQMSGIANLFYNLGDSLGTYTEGLFINYSLFRMPFIIASILFFILCLFIKNLEKEHTN